MCKLNLFQQQILKEFNAQGFDLTKYLADNQIHEYSLTLKVKEINEDVKEAKRFVKVVNVRNYYTLASGGVDFELIHKDVFRVERKKAQEKKDREILQSIVKMARA